MSDVHDNVMHDAKWS